MKTIKIIFFILMVVIISPNLLYPIIYGSVSGVVTDEETGKGLPGVYVSIGGRVNLNVVTDNQGKYVAKLLKPGKYVIVFTPRFPYCNVSVPDRLYIGPGERKIINKEVKLGGSIRGKVLYTDSKKPFPGVSMYTFARFGGRDYATTGGDGSYFFRTPGQICPSTNYYIRADCQVPNVAYKLLLGVVVEKGKETEAEDILFDLNDPTGIEGYITSSIDGKPLNNVEIAVHSEDKKYPGSTEEATMGKVSTNIEGYYYIKNLEPGNYWIHIMPEIDDDWSFAEFSAHCKNKKGIIVTTRKVTRVDGMLDIQSSKISPYGGN
ncbi:MAG TPA: carboxypeptidase regulatory-like domain-containing protein [Candidatus Kapabacteria bacterium]|nr:carboxypeptidase regulatory-like domain-containing protein [Candidatus Kapabacteria bacterium]